MANDAAGMAHHAGEWRRHLDVVASPRMFLSPTPFRAAEYGNRI